MNGTIARLTASSLLRRWRGLLLALLPVALLLLSGAMVGLFGREDDITVGLLGGLNLGTVVPLIALIVGTGAISTEVDDGSIVYLLTKPIPRWKIILTKLAVATGVALAFAAVPTFLAAILLTGMGSAAIAYTVSAAISCVVYCAVFIMLGVLSRHAVIIGLMYILLWENLVAGLVGGAKTLSIQYWGHAVAAKLAPADITSTVNIIAAVALAVVVTLAATWFASHRLRALTLAGEG